MTLPVIATIDSLLSSAVVGGVATCVSILLLATAQMLQWRQDMVARRVRIGVGAVAVLSCLVVAVLIAARFLIIR